MRKLTQPIFTKFGRKVARKKPLDFGGYPDHVTLGLRLGLQLTATAVLFMGGYALPGIV